MLNFARILSIVVTVWIYVSSELRPSKHDSSANRDNRFTIHRVTHASSHYETCYGNLRLHSGEQCVTGSSYLCELSQILVGFTFRIYLTSGQYPFAFLHRQLLDVSWKYTRPRLGFGIAFDYKSRPWFTSRNHFSNNNNGNNRTTITIQIWIVMLFRFFPRSINLSLLLFYITFIFSGIIILYWKKLNRINVIEEDRRKEENLNLTWFSYVYD